MVSVVCGCVSVTDTGLTRKTEKPCDLSLVVLFGTVGLSHKFLTILNHPSVQYPKYTEASCCCLHCLQYILTDLPLTGQACSLKDAIIAAMKLLPKNSYQKLKAPSNVPSYVLRQLYLPLQNKVDEFVLRLKLAALRACQQHFHFRILRIILRARGRSSSPFFGLVSHSLLPHALSKFFSKQPQFPVSFS